MLLIFTSQVNYDSIEETYRMIAPIALFLVLINVIRDENERKLSIYLLLGSGLIFTLYNYVSFYLSPGLGTSALTSNWGYQNTFAAFLVLMIQTSLGTYLDEQNKYRKMFLSILPIFFMFILFLTTSRGGFIAFGVSIVVLIISTSKSNYKKIFRELLPVFLGAIALIIFGAPKEIILANLGKATVLANFIGDGNDYSLGMRLYFIKLSGEIFLKKPIFGFGLGSFRYTFTQYNREDIFFRIDPHSLFLKLLSETGILGTTTYFSFLGYYLLKAFKTLKTSNNFYNSGIFAGLIGMLFHMCIDVDIYPVIFVLIMVALAILVKGKFVKISIKQRAFLSVVCMAILIIFALNLLPKAIGGIYAAKGEKPKSLKTISVNVENMRKAIKYDPNSFYYFTLGDLIGTSMNSFDEEKIAEMKEAYEKAHEMNRLDYKPILRLGISELFNRNPKAIEYFEEAYKLYPMNYNLLPFLAVSYAYIYKDAQTATYFVNKAAESNANSQDIYFAKGVIELVKGNKDSAEKNFKNLSFYTDIAKQFNDINLLRKELTKHLLELKIIDDLEKEIKAPNAGA
ncbi:MAG: O-antigen ligase family protein [Sulfolobaceae archaeon]